MRRNRNYWLGLGFVLFSVAGIYLFNQANTIYGGDAGDLVSAIAVFGIPHPPGYPLYTFLGILVNKLIPFGTLAWKIGFLSSIPAVLTAVFLYDLLILQTISFLPAVIATLVFAFVYPIWLYAEIPEVFSLNNFFLVLLLWTFWNFQRIGKNKYLYIGAFVVGLSLSHHHIIVFLFPAVFYLLFPLDFARGRHKRKIITRTAVFKSLFFLSIGFVPYLYPLFVAISNPAVNWQGPSNLTNFINLVTRAGYGTFTAGNFIAHQPVLRLLDVLAFFDFVYKDFRFLGLILFLLGAIFLFKEHKALFWTLTIAFISFVFFLFYASFPLLENFMLGTFERFIQPLYLIVSIIIAFGVVNFLQLLEKIPLFEKDRKKLFLKLSAFLFLIYPIGLFTINYPKISILKNDFTAENLGRDILNSVAGNSILIISTDTPLFNTQYVYYTQEKWQNIKLIHLTKLYTTYYTDQLKKHYPDLSLPPSDTDPAEKFRLFVENNYSKFPIFSKLAFADEKGVWVPWGLLFRYFKKEDLPKNEEILKENEKLWANYDNPLTGSLSKYQNLIQSDILRVYALSHQEIGFWAAKRGFSKVAEKHLLSAEKLFPDDLDSYTILAQVYIVDKRCQDAQKQIETILEKDKESLESYYLQALNYAACFKDPVKAAYFQKLYEEKTRGKETKLPKL